MLVVLFVSLRRRKKEPLSAADDEEIRENIIAYDDEGGGEEDTEAFDIAALRTLQTPSRPNSVRRHDMRPELASAMPGTSLCSGRECPATVDIAGFIAGRVRQADDDPGFSRRMQIRASRLLTRCKCTPTKGVARSPVLSAPSSHSVAQTQTRDTII